MGDSADPKLIDRQVLAVPLLVFGDPRFEVSFAPQIAVLAGTVCIVAIDRVRASQRT